MNQSVTTPSGAKYNNSRVSLLTIVILSAVNLFSIAFAGTYFLFSAYLPQLLTVYGVFLAEKSGSPLFLVIAVVLSIIVIVPYFVLWILSKKRVGCMIAALVLFAIDSIIFLPDFIFLLQSGDFSMIIDIVIRIWALGSLAFGVKYGFDAKREAAQLAEAPIPDESAAGEAAVPVDAGVQRVITVTRQRSFVGMAVPIIFYIGQTEVCRLKNGETAHFEASSAEFVLTASATSGMGAGSITVPAGTDPLSYTAAIKNGLMSSKIEITPMNML